MKKKGKARKVVDRILGKFGVHLHKNPPRTGKGSRKKETVTV
jgi:hypothetical protein